MKLSTIVLLVFVFAGCTTSVKMGDRPANKIEIVDVKNYSLGEPARITERRKALRSVFETLKNSLKVLQRDPDISANTTGDEELEAMLKNEAMSRRNESMA